MRTRMALILMLATGSLLAQTHFSIGIGIGGPRYYAPPPPVVAYAPPTCPGPGYTWIAGYWYPVGPRWAWHAGYWSRPPFAGAFWVAPSFHESRFFAGRWERRGTGWDRGDRSRWEHRERRGDGDRGRRWSR
ncbi:MAG: YXWGXW repeat-containing protein [Acidobacteriia bacterium]|nr:YXWGXW repeat-containing protein [Terriglobia bacterium]